MRGKTILSLFLAALSVSQAALITIEADDFAFGTNLTSAITNCEVTTSGANSSWYKSGIRYEADVYALHTGTLFQNASGVLYPLGQHVLGYKDKNNAYCTSFDDYSVRLRINFTGLAKSIYLDTAGLGHPQSITKIKGYDAGNNKILDLSTNKSVRYDQPEQISYSFSDYRLAYAIEDDRLYILVIDIAHRKDIYRGI